MSIAVSAHPELLSFSSRNTLLPVHSTSNAVMPTTSRKYSVVQKILVLTNIYGKLYFYVILTLISFFRSLWVVSTKLVRVSHLNE